MLMVLSNSKISVSNCRSRIDIYCLIKLRSGLFVFFLLLINIAETPPSVIMSLVSLESFLITLMGISKIFIFNIFMTAKSMSISEEYI